MERLTSAVSPAAVLGVVFVLLAIANVSSILNATGRSRDETSRERLIRIHRIGGYAFVGLFCAMTYFMALRLEGLSDELPPRLVIHLVLTLAIAPLLFVKILIVRYYRRYAAALLPIGLSIFVGSFILVMINLLPHWLGNAAPSETDIARSIGVVVVIVAAVGYLLARRAAAGGTIVDVRPPVRAGARRRVLRLAHVEAQTPDSRTLRFVVRDEDRFTARPGQFLKLRFDIDGTRAERCYSISSSPTQTAYVEITPKRVADGLVSGFLNDRAGVGLVVEAEGPFGRFTFDERKHERVVLIAGGSGITPILSILRYIDDCSLDTPATLIYCVRTRSDIIFEAELERLKSRLRNFRALHLVSRPDEDWRGPSGRITRDFVSAHVEGLASSTFFVCGPQPFMEAVQKILASLNVDPARIKLENFQPKRMSSTAQDADDEDGSIIEFARSGKRLVSVGGRSLLEIAESNGVAIPSGCRAGQCGACMTRLLDGEVEMSCEDALDSGQKARGDVLLCVGRAKGNVRLDA
jgi:ferredoxin-NADP reductase